MKNQSLLTRLGRLNPTNNSAVGLKTKFPEYLFCMLILFANAIQVNAQGVGINTTSPHPSAALDIQSTNKGILIPQVELQNSVDNSTVPNPATGLLVYNKNNNALSGAGYYQNTGTAASPNWEILSRLKLPYSHGVSTPTAFYIQNYLGNGSTAIRAYAFGLGTGLLTESDKGYALQVKGSMKIFGNGQDPGTGKILTSNATGEATWQGAVAFSAVGVKGNGGEVVAKDTEYKIPFAVEQYDLGDNYKDFNQSPASSFVAPVNGIYHFDAYVSYALAQIDDPNELPTITTQTAIMKISNGVKSIIAIDDKYSIPVSSSLLSIDVLLAAGDQVHVTFAHLTVYNHLNLRNCYFTGRLVVNQ